MELRASLGQAPNPLNPNCLWGMREDDRIICFKCKEGYVSVYQQGEVQLPVDKQCIPQKSDKIGCLTVDDKDYSKCGDCDIYSGYYAKDSE